MAVNPSFLEEALGTLLGQNSPGQIALYAIVQSMVSEALEPFLSSMRQVALQALPVTPLSPAELADMVNRGIKDQATAQPEAQLSGINSDRFASLVQASGESPGLDVLARAYRLGIIPFDSGDPSKPGFLQGVQQSRVRNLWTNTVAQVARAYPTPDLLVQAWLRGQVDEATARATYALLGGVPEFFDTQFNVAGRPPSPLEAAEMVHRGLIPPSGFGASVLSYDQAVRESDLKDKWGPALFQLAEYIPPPRTVVALVRAGTLDDATALQVLQKDGLSAELAASYVAEAHSTKTAADKQLAKNDVLTLYQEQVLSVQQATPLLQALGFTVEDATFLLEMVDFRRELAAVNAAVSKFANLYINHKITYNQAVVALDNLGIVATQRDLLLRTWTFQREANVRTLTADEIRKAVQGGIITPDTALTRLQDLGFNTADALIYLQL